MEGDTTLLAEEDAMISAMEEEANNTSTAIVLRTPRDIVVHQRIEPFFPSSLDYDTDSDSLPDLIPIPFFSITAQREPLRDLTNIISQTYPIIHRQILFITSMEGFVYNQDYMERLSNMPYYFRSIDIQQAIRELVIDHLLEIIGPSAYALDRNNTSAVTRIIIGMPHWRTN